MKSSMLEAEIEFIERFGLMFEEDGLPKIAGRIFALLMLTDRALTLDEIAATLQVSKTSASTNTRMLDGMRFLERTSRPGDRKAYYRLAPNGLEMSFERTRQRMKEVLELLDTVSDGFPEKREVALRRLKRMREWHAFILAEMDGIWLRWQEREKEQDS